MSNFADTPRMDRFAARQAEFLRFEQAAADTNALEKQIAALRMKILQQRHELNILVDGV